MYPCVADFALKNGKFVPDFPDDVGIVVKRACGYFIIGVFLLNLRELVRDLFCRGCAPVVNGVIEIEYFINILAF